MIKDAKKISIIGGSGTGKTTLANSLGEILDIPVYHIDGIHHLENWVIRDSNERDKIILEKVLESKWIIDGTYRSTLQERLDNSDFVIYLDYSSFAQVRGILSRFFKNHGKEKKEIPGCKERMSFEFFMFVCKWRKTRRDEIVERISKVDKSKVLIFKNRRQLNKWFKNEFGKKIVNK